MNQDIINIDTRKLIWITLSEFYLDTELTQEDLDRIAKIFARSGLGLQEIKDIDRFEVFPLLQKNLLSAAGLWAGFDEKWLIEGCERGYRKRENTFYKINCIFWHKLFYWMRKDYWKAIELIQKQ